MSLRAGDLTIIGMIILYIYISKTTNYCRGFGCCSYYSDVRNVEPWWQDES